MHRLIMLSSTYRPSSVADEESLEKDPENHLLEPHEPRGGWTAIRMRDTILAVAGTLNLKMGGVGRDSAADEGRDPGRAVCRISGRPIPIRPSTTGAASICR